MREQDDHRRAFQPIWRIWEYGPASRLSPKMPGLQLTVRIKEMPFGTSISPINLPLESRRTQVSRVGVLIIFVCLVRRLLRFADDFFAIILPLRTILVPKARS
jgi:hypothetical protein